MRDNRHLRIALFAAHIGQAFSQRTASDCTHLNLAHEILEVVTLGLAAVSIGAAIEEAMQHGAVRIRKIHYELSLQINPFAGGSAIGDFFQVTGAN